MSFFRQSDIQGMYARLGGHDIKLALGSDVTKGLVDIIDESLLQDSSLSLGGSTKTIHAQTGSLTGLEVGSELIDLTDNVHYRVQQFLQVGDGAETVIYVADL